MELLRQLRIVTRPDAYWNDAITAPASVRSLLVPRVLVLAALPPLATLVGGTRVLLQALEFGAFGRALGGIVAGAVLGYGVQIASWLLLAVVINALAGPFRAQRDFGQALKLALGAMIPAWLGQALSVTSITWLGIVGLLAGLGYGCFALARGLPPMNGTPAGGRAWGYALAATGINVLITLVLGAVAAAPGVLLMGSAFGR